MHHKEITIGLISDTHGLLRSQVMVHLKDCDAIIHAGDICDDKIIDRLRQIAPVYPVAGNMDEKGNYPVSDIIEMGEYTIYIIHDLATVDLDLKAAGIDIVIFGHSHQPTRFTQGQITFINPGSAGPERPRKPISMAILRLRRERITTNFIEL